VFLGRYPEQGLERFGGDLPRGADADRTTIQQPLDSFGVNAHHGTPTRAGRDGAPELLAHPGGSAITAFAWVVAPQAMYWAARFFHERYAKPIVVTEKGISCRDWIAVDGQVHDPDRIDFTTRYLRELERAIDDGVPVEGYFHWSIMDNFEWAHGYKHRFGLTFVDYATQRRVLKDSAHWYREVIASNGRSLHE